MLDALAPELPETLEPAAAEPVLEARAALGRRPAGRLLLRVDRPAGRAAAGARHPRPLRRRQDDAPALPQPADRPDARASPSPARSCSWAARSAAAGSTSTRCARGSACSSSSRSSSPAASPTTSCSASATPAVPPRRDWPERIERGAARGGALGRGPRPPPRAGGEPLRRAAAAPLPRPRRSPGEPEVLLLDEPTSALDAGATAAIEELILRLRERHAIVLVTHSLRQARRVADSLAYLAVRDGAGEVVESGPCQNLFARPRTPELARYPLPGVRMNAPQVALKSLDTLWFQVGGTVCNLACTHCFVSCSPTNHTHEVLSLAEVERYLDEAARLGVREYYFTGGEPFLNPEMEAILAATLAVGPATVLTNGLLLDPGRCAPPQGAGGRLRLLARLPRLARRLGRREQRPDPRRRDLREDPGRHPQPLPGRPQPGDHGDRGLRGRGHRLRQGALLRAAAVDGDRAPAAQDPPRLPDRRRGRARRRLRELAAAARGGGARRGAGTTCSAAPAGWSPTRGSGSARSWSTSRRRRWARPSPTPSAPSPWSTRPAGPATPTA